jgi:DNA replication licensing factor MCM4
MWEDASLVAGIRYNKGIIKVKSCIVSGSCHNLRLSVIDNIQLPPTLLSMFDLIYLVLDKVDEHTNRCLSRDLVALHYEELEGPWLC